MEDDLALIAFGEFGPVVEGGTGERLDFEALGEGEAELEEAGAGDFRDEVNPEDDAFVAEGEDLFAKDANFGGDGSDAEGEVAAIGAIPVDAVEHELIIGEKAGVEVAEIDLGH